MKLPIQDKIDDGVLSAIGLLMVTSSGVHRALAMQLLRIVAPQGGAENAINAVVITFGMKADTLLGLLKSLVSLHFPKIAEEFNAEADVLRSYFSNKRDVLAHHAISNIKDKPDRVKVYKIKTVGKFEISTYGLTETEIRKWAKEFHDQSRKLDKLLSAAGLPKWKDFGASYTPDGEQ